MILLDTNVAIYYLQGDQVAIKSIDKLRSQKQEIAISTITEMEILSFPHLDGIQILKINEWLRTIFIIPVDSRIAREGAKFRRLYKMKTPDALIAATAFVNEIHLITRDKDFKRIKEIDLILV